MSVSQILIDEFLARGETTSPVVYAHFLSGKKVESTRYRESVDGDTRVEIYFDNGFVLEVVSWPYAPDVTTLYTEEGWIQEQLSLSKPAYVDGYYRNGVGEVLAQSIDRVLGDDSQE